MVNLKINLVIIVLLSSNVVLAKENSKSLKVAVQKDNEFTEINSAFLKVSEAARYSFADIVESLFPAVVNISTINMLIVNRKMLRKILCKKKLMIFRKA